MSKAISAKIREWSQPPFDKETVDRLKALKQNPKQLEELENHCRWPIGHPDEANFYFCGRTPMKDFSYCKLHLLFAFQPKGKKEDLIDKNDEVPQFIEKKIKSA